MASVYFNRSPFPMTDSQRLYADQLFTQYCARHKVLTKRLLAAIRAGANSVARHGNPPNRNQRLAYRMHKKRRAKLEAIKLYGSPTQPD